MNGELGGNMQYHYNGLAEYANVHTAALSDIIQRDHCYRTNTIVKRKPKTYETHSLIDMCKLPANLQAMAGFIHE